MMAASPFVLPSPTDLAAQLVPHWRPAWGKDPIVRASLDGWSKAPWNPAHGMVLADRLEEMGLPWRADVAREILRAAALVMLETGSLPRRARGRMLRGWRLLLATEFGDWSEDPLPCEGPADTPTADEGEPF